MKEVGSQQIKAQICVSNFLLFSPKVTQIFSSWPS